MKYVFMEKYGKLSINFRQIWSVRVAERLALPSRITRSWFRTLLETVLLCSEPFMFTLPSSWYDWNTVEKDVKPKTIHPSPNPHLISFTCRERGGSVVECRTPEREVGGSKPTAAVLCPWARHFTPRKYWLITQEAMAPSRHDWKIVDWDVKPQHNQPKSFTCILSVSVKMSGYSGSYLIHLVYIWASSWDYGTYHIGNPRRFRQACASAQSHQSLRCSHT